MQLFVIGPKDHPRQPMHALGLARSGQAELDAMKASGPPAELFLFATHDLEPGWDQLALAIVKRELRAGDAGRDWFRVTREDALAAAARAATRCSGPPPAIETPDFGRLIRHLRKVVFGTNQTVFGQIAGGASPSAVSRWEGGEAEPSISDMARIRSFAASTGLQWDDAWLFDPPGVSQAGS